MTERTIIVVQENWTESAVRDLTSVACALVLIGFGVVLESSAMQWFGFLFAGVAVFARASGLRKKMSCSPQEGIDRLQAIIDAK